MLSVELKEKSFGSFELKLEGSASGFCTGRACFFLLPSAFYLLLPFATQGLGDRKKSK
ncbi:hypothetical protein DBT_0927 [Dissulfuribacter thermophilus]|uniref:Uncharacterized protein n=1 Tax=Dissulfuribacter thermophilus TaxID=1156395 RepID=A0A1B9F6P4_9BACT|nr:hypothetical protein DBT_0927 [Dissulfuribacter thermophilus]